MEVHAKTMLDMADQVKDLAKKVAIAPEPKTPGYEVLGQFGIQLLKSLEELGKAAFKTNPKLGEALGNALTAGKALTDKTAKPAGEAKGSEGPPGLPGPVPKEPPQSQPSLEAPPPSALNESAMVEGSSTPEPPPPPPHPEQFQEMLSKPLGSLEKRIAEYAIVHYDGDADKITAADVVKVALGWKPE